MSGLLLKYFVLKPASKMKEDIYAYAARDAMEAYARRVEFANPELAEDLLEWVEKEDSVEELKFGETRKECE
jgi:hypothetical protein